MHLLVYDGFPSFSCAFFMTAPRPQDKTSLMGLLTISVFSTMIAALFFYPNLG